MPDVGEGITEGEIVRWLVDQGAVVEEDAPLVEVQTDKAVVQIPSPAGGTLLRRGADEGGVVKVGDTLAVIGQAGEDAGAAQAPVKAPEAQAAVAELPAAAALQDAASTVQGPVKATPGIRHRARELGIDLSRLAGTGPGGRITSEDLERAAHAPVAAVAQVTPPAVPTAAVSSAAAPAPAVPSVPTAPVAALPPAPAPAGVSGGATIVPLRGLRRTIAQHMVRSMFTVPHVTTADRAEVSALLALRNRLRPAASEQGVKLTYLPFVVKAAVVALKEFPYVNASLDDERQEIQLHHDYHVGIATATEEGLMVPVVHDADRKSILQVAKDVSALAARARARASTLEELRGSTFTITNVGAAGALSATPVINHPEVAILGMYRAVEEPIVRDGRVVPGRVMNLTLTFDHRVIDGEMGARFIRRVAELLETPDLLTLEMP